MVPNRKSFRIARRASILFLQMLIPFSLAIGQPGGTGDLDANPDAAVPVDGGLSLLIAAGAVYGGRTLVKKRSRNK